MRRELTESLEAVNEQIKVIKDRTSVPAGSSIYDMRYSDGKFILADLLVTRANLVMALVNLASLK